jgi:hypothetical protein
MTDDEVDVGAAREAALAALRSLPTRETLPAQRAELVAVAWHCGERNIAELARNASVSRDIIYDDLRKKGIDPADRGGPARPRYRPLNPASVRQAADVAAVALTGAMLAGTPDPVTLSAWQASIGLQRVAEVVGAGEDLDERCSGLRDLAVRGDYVRQYANQALAEQVPQEKVAATLAQETQLAYELGDFVVTGATVQVSLPDDRRTTVRIGTRGGASPMADWIDWVASDGVRLPVVSAYVYAEVHAAFDILAKLFSGADIGEGARSAG